MDGALKEKTSSAFSLWKGGKITLSLLLFFLFALHLLIPVHAEGQWVNQENGWLGECSTEISGVNDLHVLKEDIPN